jgi:hypothetical protein
MTRNIISKFIIVLIVLFTGLSLFWFFKTSAIKKQTLAFIAESGGKISATSVSVSGFPLQQKLTIDDLKFQLAANLPQTPLMPANNKYQVNIKKLEAASSILSGEFKVTTIEDISFQDQNDVSSLLQFNQPPQAEFSVVGGELVKFLYQDTGYKILDSGKNILFENGNSSINFESNIVDNKYHNKVKVEFKDVGMFNSLAINNSPAVGEAVLPDAQNTTQVSPQVSQDNAQISPEVTNAATNNVPNQNGGNLVKKSFTLDIEYIVAKSTSSTAEVPAPDAQEVAAVDTVADSSKLESITIKNFEISSPLYKININGEISSFQDQGFPISSISARIEKFDNVLIYLKKPLSDMTSAKVGSSEIVNPVNNIAIDGDTAVSPVSNAPTSDSATMPAASQNPELDVISIIKDLSKKNPATNDEIAVFDFRQEQGKDLLINETSLSEIMAQMFPFPVGSAVGNDALPSAAPVAVSPEGSLNAQPAVPAPAVSPIVVPNPAAVAPKPNNAN